MAVATRRHNRGRSAPTCTTTRAYREGHLEKQRRLKTWTWKQYWFVLDGDQLSYYKDRELTIARGLIDLAQATAVRACPSAFSKGFTFEIAMTSRVYNLSADTAQSRDGWVTEIEKAMQLSLRRFPSMHVPSCDSISEDELPEEVLSNLTFIGRTKKPGSGQSKRSASEGDCMRILRNNNISMNAASSCPQRSPLIEKLSGDVCMRNGRFRKATYTRSNSSVTSVPTSTDEDDDVFTNSMAIRRNHPLNSSIKSHESSSTTCESTSSGDCDVTNCSDVASGNSVACAEEETREEEVTITAAWDNVDNESQFPPVPPLPHPRLELTHRSAFDDIRLFIAHHRDSDEVYVAPRNSQFGGRAVNRLRRFLQLLDEEYS